MLLSLCACAKVLLHVAAFIAAMSPAAPVSGAWHAPWAGLASVEHLHRERFVTRSAGARGARSQYDFRPKCAKNGEWRITLISKMPKCPAATCFLWSFYHPLGARTSPPDRQEGWCRGPAGR